MKNLLVAAVLSASIGCALPAPEPNVAVEMSATHVASDVVEALDQVVRTEMSANDITGVAVGLVTERGLAWGAGYGVCDRRTRTPVTVDTRFPIASITKPLTATGLLLLVQRDVLRLGDRVQSYLPDFSPPACTLATGPHATSSSQGITIRHVLSHHAGLVRDLQKGMVGPSHDDVDLVAELSQLFLADAPGTNYRYSNVGYAVLGTLIEEVTGVSYAEFMREAVFGPLGMSSTSVGVGPNDRNEFSFAAGHKITGLIIPRTHEVMPQERRDAAAGSVVSTVRDLSAFVAMLLGNGVAPSGRVLERSLAESMFQPPYPRQRMDEDDYALGFKIGKLSARPADARHGGTLDGYSSLIALVPEEGIGVVVLMNNNHPFARHYIANEAIRLWLDLDVDPMVRYRPVRNTVAPRSGHYVGVGDFSLHMELDLESNRMVLSGEKLSIVTERGSDVERFRIVKRIAGIGFPVAGAFNAEEAYLDFVSVESGVLPRITLWYRNLPLEMLFQPVPESVEVTGEPAADVTGTYRLSNDCKPFAAPGISAITVHRRDGLLLADVGGIGISRMVLHDSKATESTGAAYQALGTGETFRFEGDKLSFSGLEYEREE